MTTAEIVAERALGSAGSDVDDETAVRDLLDLAQERRVAIVRARQLLADRTDGDGDAALERAVRLLDDALARIPV